MFKNSINVSCLTIVFFLSFLATSCKTKDDNKEGVIAKYVFELTEKSQVNSDEKIIIDDIYRVSSYNNRVLYIHQESLTEKRDNFIKFKAKPAALPIFSDGVIYYADQEGRINAISEANGSKIWSHDFSSRALQKYYNGGGLAISEGKLYVTNGSRFLFVINLEGGYEILAREFDDRIKSKPIIVKDNKILIQTVTNHIIFYDIVNSNLVWDIEGEGDMINSTNYISPLIYKDNFIFNYNTGKVFSVNMNNLNINWQFYFKEGIEDLNFFNLDSFSFSTEPIIDQNDLYIANNSGKIAKLNIETGETIWSSKVHDVQSMSLLGNNLFVINNAKQILALSLKDGKVKWVSDIIDSIKKDKNQNKALVFLPPLLVRKDNEIYIAALSNNRDLYLYKYDSENQLLSCFAEYHKTAYRFLDYILGPSENCPTSSCFITDRGILFNQ